MPTDDLTVRMRAAGSRAVRRDLDDTGRGLRKFGVESDKTKRRVELLGKALTGLEHVLGLIHQVVRSDVIIVGLGAIGGILGAVGVAAVAAGSALGPLVGVIPALGVAGVGAAAGLGVFKVAMLGVKEASKGMFKDFHKQTPAVTALLREISSLEPVLLHLKNQIQGRVLGGFTDAIRTTAPLLKSLGPEVVRISAIVGMLTRQLALMLVRMGPALRRVLHAGGTALQDYGISALHIVEVLIRLADAARPLSMWLGRITRRWTESVVASTKAGEASGGLTRFFQRTHIVLARLFSILGNVGRALHGVSIAASGMGLGLWETLDKTTARWARLANTAKGQNHMREFFAQAKPVIMETGGLLKDIFLMFGHLTVAGSEGLTPMIRKLRELVPIFEGIVEHSSQAFGPAFVDMLIALANAFSPFFGATGPLVLFTKSVTALANAFAWFVDNVPGAKGALVTLVATMTILKTIGLASFISELFGTSKGLKAIGVAATFCKGQIDGLKWSLAVVRGAFAAAWATALGPIAIIVAAIALVAGAFYLLYTRVGWFHHAVDAVWAAMKTAVGAFVGWVKDAAGSILGFIESRINNVIDVINFAIKAYNKLPFHKDVGLIGHLGAHASGGIVNTRYQLVGERGPEITELPRGTRVHPTGTAPRALREAVEQMMEVVVPVTMTLDGAVVAKATARQVVKRRSTL